uniref:Sugar phosphate transporter domain-containing protein n=1 Tax=Coccolithus braarudii TaxID=221442 RepID=A0A7S0QAW9_9EUKA|mmetsp:Transcript_6451/g.14085  ORF Transcript_6451/g.14085 Transcript_6451/m.14085 type:complete len:389 (+) Transcript_6451:12-1178(+)
MGAHWQTTIYAVANISCSVSLVLVNKIVFAAGFAFPMTLTCLHFGFTVIFYRTLSAFRLYDPKVFPTAEAFKMAAAGVGSIGFMNISLNLNSVGFYQITKLAIVPCTLVAQAYLFNVTVSRKVKLALAILLLGLGMATVTDVQLNAPGVLLGVLAVLTTTIFQLWQGSKQKEYELSATQLQAAVSFWQALQSLSAAVALENLCVQIPAQDGSSTLCSTAVGYVSDPSTRPGTLWLVMLTCFIALGTNFSSFGLIGRTSAITFQVIGHAKTCFVLAGGFLLWPLADSTQLINNVIGVSTAMVGCILYGHIKMAEASQRRDIIDRVCPLFLSPARYEPLPTGDEGPTKPIRPPTGDGPVRRSVSLASEGTNEAGDSLSLGAPPSEAGRRA